jgi:hypothetical protein
MKTLEQKAEEYVAQACDDCDIWVQIIAEECYIAGANSKWVQAEKIKAQIDMLKSIGTVHDERCMSQRVTDKIKELQQQLKQLEDETKI